MPRMFYDTSGAEVDMDKASALLDSKGLAIRWKPKPAAFPSQRRVRPIVGVGPEERFEVELYRKESGVHVTGVEVPAGKQIAAAKGLLDRVERGEFDQWR